MLEGAGLPAAARELHAGMKPLSEFRPSAARRLDFVLSDLDDTLTYRGKLPAESYAGLERLHRRAKRVIVVTGRPAGWCDMIARLWPVDGVVGENGAFYYRYRPEKSLMVRHYVRSAAERARDRKTLMRMFAQVKRRHKTIRLSNDQPFRVSDVAIDMCEDTKPLSHAEVASIVAELEDRGATVKVSSIHINFWLGRFDKLTTIRTMLGREFRLTDASAKRRALYVGDSPNDEPMFAFFPASVGVANVARFAADMKALPAYVTRREGGFGFMEVARLLTRPT
jgi:HAD superfamily hydrolase (TIGR01484 family)